MKCLRDFGFVKQIADVSSRQNRNIQVCLRLEICNILVGHSKLLNGERIELYVPEY